MVQNVPQIKKQIFRLKTQYYKNSEQMAQTLNPQKKVNLHFLIKKQVRFGEALYVVGSLDALGKWDPSNSLRLNWNSEDYWSGFVELKIRDPLKIYFKYLIGSFDRPFHQNPEWQSGDFNRQLTVFGDEDNIVIQNVWACNKICLNLLVPKKVIRQNTQIYLAGGCNELGNWRSRLKLTKAASPLSLQQCLANSPQPLDVDNYNLYTITVTVQNQLKNFKYYFILETNQQQVADRVPMREFKMNNPQPQNDENKYLHIENRAGNYQLVEMSKFVNLHYVKIIDRIFLGACIQTIEDVKELKSRGVKAIVYVTSCQITKSKTVPKCLIKMVSEQNGLEYRTIKIDTSQTQNLIKQIKQGLSILEQLIQNQQKTVYIFCGSGTLLSPLLVALYLSVYEQVSLTRALEYVKQKYPTAIINESMMAMAVELTEERYFEREGIVGRGNHHGMADRNGNGVKSVQE